MLFFVIPCLDERDNMPALFAGLRAATHGLDAVAILVDDGSTDGTADAAREHAGELPLDVVTHERNRGLGRAVESGLRRALELSQDDGDLVVTIEGDNTSDLADLPVILAAAARGADVVMASTELAGGGLIGVSGWRVAASKAVATAFRILGGLREFRSITPLYRAYRVGLLRRAFATYGDVLVQESGFAVNVELLVKLRHLGPRIVEVPTTIDWNRRLGTSKLPIKPTVVAYGQLLASILRGRMAPPPGS